LGQALSKLSLDEFIVWENAQPEKHEFVRGEVLAMVGARRVHNTVVGNVFAAFKQHLKGSPCRAYLETAKLQTAVGDLFYPDVFVTCDPQDLRTACANTRWWTRTHARCNCSAAAVTASSRCTT
jgi:hypothetical protein